MTTKKVKLSDLLQSAPQSASLGSLKKKIEKYEKSQTILDAPLSKPQKEKIERTIAYQENAKDISKWAPTIKKNREAENLSFPLNVYKPPEVTIKSVAVDFKPRTSLEKEIAAVLKGSSGLLERRNKELTESEERALQVVDLQEAMERRKELQKLRALQSYYEIKCKRQKKIKSKKFRKILRKSEKKKEEKRISNITKREEEELINETEKNRVLERAHLRHRNTSKWAKRLSNKGNRSKEETQLLHDQLKVSRQLTEQKAYEPDSEDEENLEAAEDEELPLLKATADNADNPWLLGHESFSKETEQLKKSKVAEEVSDVSDDSEECEGDEEQEKKSDDEWIEAGKISTPKAEESEKPQNCEKKKRKASRSSRAKKRATQDSDLDSEAEHEHIIDIPIEPEAESHGNDAAEDGHKTDDAQAPRVEDTNIESDKRGRMKKDNFLLVESKALNVDKMLVDSSDFDFTKSDEQRALVKEAFANDAVFEEFAKEKEKQENLRVPKDEDFALPGWGEWAGANINNEKILKRKRKSFMKKGKKAPPSKDARLKYVIINERKNKKFVANQVSALPFPFSSESQFEKSVRQPLGKTWNTPSMTAKLIQPRISTLIGTIIDPMKTGKEAASTAMKRTKRTKNNISSKNKSQRI